MEANRQRRKGLGLYPKMVIILTLVGITPPLVMGLTVSFWGGWGNLGAGMVLAHVLFVMIIVAVVVVPAAHLLSKSIANPIRDLGSKAKGLGEGRLDERIRVDRTDEIGELGRSLEAMRVKLKRSQDRIRTDVRKRTKELEKEKAYSENVVKSMADSLIVTDLDWNVVSINMATQALTGYSEKELLGRSLSVILWPGGLSEKNAKRLLMGRLGEIMKKGAVRYREVSFFTKYGMEVPQSFSASLMKDRRGEPQGIVCVAQDLTNRRRSEMQLMEERNRAELYLDLLCHDISNLNQPIMSYTELLMMREDLDREVRHNLTTTFNQSQAISILVCNVRKISQLRSSDFHFEPMNFRKLLSNAAVYVKATHRDRNIKVKLRCKDDDVLVVGNELLLDVFVNIIGNAVKYDRNEEVEIEVSVGHTEANGFWRMEIADRGPGIPDDQKEIIFKRLERGDKSIRGTGLGLTIVREIVERCGGEVWVEDRVPGDHTRGSKFVVLLLDSGLRDKLKSGRKRLRATLSELRERQQSHGKGGEA